MKIAIVSDVLGEENNGTTIAAMNLINWLKSKGHDVRVICPDPEKATIPGYYIVKTLNVGPFNGYVAKNGVSISRPDKKVIEKALKDIDATLQNTATNITFLLQQVFTVRQKIFQTIFI